MPSKTYDASWVSHETQACPFSLVSNFSIELGQTPAEAELPTTPQAYSLHDEPGGYFMYFANLRSLYWKLLLTRRQLGIPDNR